jgi:hypothetical protein
VRDETTDPAKRRAAPAGKDAKLAAALKANIARRKAAPHKTRAAENVSPPVASQTYPPARITPDSNESG